MRRKKIVAICLMGALAMSALTGCGIGANKTVATMEGADVPYGIVNFMCMYQQAYADEYYRSMYGDEVWDMELFRSGESAQESVKEDAVENVHEMYTLDAHAPENLLVEEDYAAIDAAVEKFMASNSKKTLCALGADEDLVREFLRLSTVRSKMYEQIIEDVDTQVSDEEANVRLYTAVTIDLMGYTAEDGSVVAYTEEEKASRVDMAEAMVAAMADASELEAVAEQFGYTATQMQDSQNYSYIEAEVKNALDELSEGTASGVIVTETAAYVVRLDAASDAELTQQNRESIIANRKYECYSAKIAEWQENDGWTVKKGALDSIVFYDHFVSATGDESVETTEE